MQRQSGKSKGNLDFPKPCRVGEEEGCPTCLPWECVATPFPARVRADFLPTRDTAKVAAVEGEPSDSLKTACNQFPNSGFLNPARRR